MKENKYQIGIDTSTANFLVLVLLCKKKIISEFSGPCNLESDFIKQIDLLLKKNNLTISQINWFFLGSGPGSFMGLRIGFATVRIWAWLFQIPIHTISSLDLLAQSHPLYAQATFVPCIDAKMGRIFANIQCNGKKNLPDQDIQPKDLVLEIHKIAQPVIILGSGGKILEGFLDQSKNIEYDLEYRISAQGFLHIIQNQTAYTSTPLAECLPSYLRLSHAEIEQEKLLR